MHNLQVEQTPIHALRPHRQNARTHSKRQIRQIANSIRRFGFCNAILVDDDLTILAGHGRVEAAKLLGLTSVPTVRLSHLSDAEKRAYVIADNRLAEKAGWDRSLLALNCRASSISDLMSNSPASKCPKSICCSMKHSRQEDYHRQRTMNCRQAATVRPPAGAVISGFSAPIISCAAMPVIRPLTSPSCRQEGGFAFH